MFFLEFPQEPGERSSPPHQLPDHRQGQGGVSIVKVLTSDAHQGEISGLPQIHSVVAVLQLQKTTYIANVQNYTMYFVKVKTTRISYKYKNNTTYIVNVQNYTIYIVNATTYKCRL